MSFFDTVLSRPLRLIFGLVVLLVIASLTLVIVPEDKQALIIRYGQINSVVNQYKPNERFGSSGAGLVARIPFFDSVVFFDKRILGANMQNERVLTTDQYLLEVDAFARFRITNPSRTYTSIRSEENLKGQLTSILGSSLRNELGKRSFASLLSAERGNVMTNIQNALNREARRYGAEVIDVRIKRADLPAGTPLDAAFNRMRSAREQEAVAIRALGQKEAQIIRGNADAEAARIYAEAYGKDAQFYDFYRAMQSYRQTFLGDTAKNANNSIILSPNSEYLRQFRGN
ncbi:MAG: protease modulator HflC [Sphingopyxis sp.]|jgi:membrane protease subunit HflC|uniref:protease modulator HflC n=1 Tax=Sphingopyxis sp. TaxID=1908224 RepID=UPI001A497CED|nr:protease modulator HflC [Sphingopyxis sp.]MBL9071923.1 protease modulator HflC [Sphingopyxis sp.]